MKLTDLLPVEGWKTIEEQIHNKFGLNAYVYDTEGISITNSKKWANQLCPLIKANEKGLAFICAVANRNLANEAIRKKRPIIGECDAGLIKVSVPIFVGDQFLGVVGGCGRTFDHSEVESFLIHKVLEVDEENIEQLARDIPRITESDVDRLISYIQEQITTITD
ncbi:MAG: PocR ligand-binding domain-containing protein [Deltaproteobacteria bacterium]|nr:PocR ligand-binding domain-containing protein [Deltaproteobacteria bacterium]